MDQKKDGTHQDTPQLYRMKDLAEIVGAPRSTLTDYAIEFAAYIPTVKHGRTKYYKAEAIGVLRRITDLRDNDYDKTQIGEILAQEYTVDAEVITNKAEKYRQGQDGNLREGREAIYVAMQAVGELSERVGNLTEQVGSQAKQLEKQGNHIQQQQQQIDRQSEEIERQRQEAKDTANERDQKITELMKALQEQKQQQIAAAKEAEETRNNRGFWKRLFNID